MGLRAWAAWQNGQTALGPWSLLALEWQSAFNPVWARKPLCLPAVNLSPEHFVLRSMCQINCAWAVDFFPCAFGISTVAFWPLSLGRYGAIAPVPLVISSEHEECAHIHRSSSISCQTTNNYLRSVTKCDFAHLFFIWLLISTVYFCNCKILGVCLTIMLRCVACNLNYIQNAEKKIRSIIS